MATKKFSEEFYKQLYDALYDWFSKGFENPDGEPTFTKTIDVTVDDYDIEAEVEVYCEYEDESFDHAFGTWVDEYAGYNKFGDVALLSAKAYDAENEYDIDVAEYNKQFVKTEHNGHKAGDIVNVIGRYGNVAYKAVMLNYNTFTGFYKVQYVNEYGKTKEDLVTRIRKCA